MAKLTKRADDYSKWYNELVVKAELAENSAVRGCMVINPYGFSIWEKMRDELDRQFKATGHQNAYFPIFIPKSFFEKEAEHVEGFAKEAAVVTHYRLKAKANGKGLEVDPDAKLEEEYIVRPTSETIIWSTYKKWIQSYRDLPLLINQWANVVRWEMRTRLFLRTAEFLWQEGHTAHATKDEAIEEAEKMLQVYKDFAENFLAIPVHTGVKSESERFAGALDTYAIEALMQDGKALQAGTSHFLGQNSDDYGLVLPPKVAPIHVVIVPIYKTDEQLEAVRQKIEPIIKELQTKGFTVKFDDDTKRKPGWKFSQYELKGVPVRLAIGQRDLDNNTVELARRDTLEKKSYSFDGIADEIENLLDEIQKNLYTKALKFREENSHKVDTWDEFVDIIDNKGGFILAHWDGTAETEAQIQEITKATIRVIPDNAPEEDGKCIFSGKPSKRRVLFAKAY